MPYIGRTSAGRNAYLPRNGSARIAFSVSPLTRDHMVLLVASLPAPETKTKVMAGLTSTRASAVAAELSGYDACFFCLGFGEAARRDAEAEEARIVAGKLGGHGAVVGEIGKDQLAELLVLLPRLA